MYKAEQITSARKREVGGEGMQLTEVERAGLNKKE